MTHTEAEFYRAPVKLTVRALQSQHEGAEVVVCVLLESGEHREERRLPLTVEQYCELKPVKGEIDEEFFEQLEQTSRLCQAIRSSENLLSYGANTVYTLTQKLTRRGFSREIALEAAERMQQMGMINEEAYLRREFEKCLQKLWGSKRIYAHMWERGFAKDTIERLPMLLETVDFVENCAKLMQKHYASVPTDRDERRRLVASLSRYGYSLDEIRGAFAAVGH